MSEPLAAIAAAETADDRRPVEALAGPGPEPVGPDRQPVRPGPDRYRWALLIVLRGGVLFSAALLLAGLGLYFVGGTSLPIDTGAGADSRAAGLASISAHSNPLTLISYGLFVLIALPVARVALSLVHFVRIRDWLYVLLTSAVLLVLLVSVIWGKAI